MLQVFGRAPLVEDWRGVGKWAYGAAWLAADHATARELIRARLAGTAKAATSAAMAAGRGDAERFNLVSAIARLPEAIETGRGPLADAIERAIDEGASWLNTAGSNLRSLTGRERTAFVPRFVLEAFDAGMHELGPDRHVLLREAAAQLDDVLMPVRGNCPALRTMRLYLQATLALDSGEAVITPDSAPATTGGEPLMSLGIWLSADLALTARRSTEFGAAWTTAARISGDALSKTLAGLTSGAMQSNNVVEALSEDPWATLYALAMTSEPEHASAILDCAARAQAERRVRAARSVAAWAAQAARADELESRLGIAILSSYESREGHRDCPPANALDLFSGWDIVHAAEESRASLRSAMDSSMSAEMSRRREKVRQAKVSLERVRQSYEAALDAARGKLDNLPDKLVFTEEDESAQRGCIFGFGAGCSVMATYIAVGIVLGTGGIMGKIAPLVVGIAALPIGAALMVQIACGIRRSAKTAEAAKRKTIVTEAFERARKHADSAHGEALAQGRELLEEAEAKLSEFERQLVADGRSPG